jgi:hypothetical protein
VRVPVGVVSPSRDDAELRGERFEQLLGARESRPVVREDEDLDPLGLAAKEFTLCRRREVAEEEDSPDIEHQRAIVGGLCSRIAPQLDRQAPLLELRAAKHRHTPKYRLSDQLRGPLPAQPELLDLHPVQNEAQATYMIPIPMGGDHRSQPSVAASTQVVEKLPPGWASVDKDGSAPRQMDQRGAALPYIEDLHLQVGRTFTQTQGEGPDQGPQFEPAWKQ